MLTLVLYFFLALAAYKAVSISNDLYRNGTRLAFESAKSFSKLMSSKASQTTEPEEVVSARDRLQANRKPVCILQSKAVHEALLSVGAIVEVY